MKAHALARPVAASAQAAYDTETSPPIQKRAQPQAALHTAASDNFHYTSSPIQRRANPAHGLPDTLKTGVEHLSGTSMDGVKVHYNSSRPAQMEALAYAQGSEIHVAPGQEHHLPHEAWHIAQQRQGRVPLPSTGAINNDPGLEREADVMGSKAAAATPAGTAPDLQLRLPAPDASTMSAPIQRIVKKPGTSRPFGKVLSTPMIRSAMFPVTVSSDFIEEMKALHRDPLTTYTWSKAVALVKKNLKSQGRKVTGRANRLADHTDLLTYANTFGTGPTLTSYLTKHSGLFDAAFQELEFAQGDFSFSGTMSDAQMKTEVTDVMMAMPATLARTMSSFNELAEAEVLADSTVGSAWKGNQFEQWVDNWIFPTYKMRLTYNNSALIKQRTSDGFDVVNDALWDYKHYTGVVPADQVTDYDTILTNKISDTGGKYAPTSINYLFSDKAAAVKNKSLNTTYNFNVWYIQSGFPPTPVQLY